MITLSRFLVHLSEIAYSEDGKFNNSLRLNQVVHAVTEEHAYFSQGDIMKEFAKAANEALCGLNNDCAQYIFNWAASEKVQACFS